MDETLCMFINRVWHCMITIFVYTLWVIVAWCTMATRSVLPLTRSSEVTWKLKTLFSDLLTFVFITHFVGMALVIYCIDTLCCNVNVKAYNCDSKVKTNILRQFHHLGLSCWVVGIPPPHLFSHKVKDNEDDQIVATLLEYVLDKIEHL